MTNCKECSSNKICTKCNSGYILVDNNKCMTSASLNNDQYLSLNGGSTYNSCSNVMPYCNKCDNLFHDLLHSISSFEYPVQEFLFLSTLILPYVMSHKCHTMLSK